MIDIHQKTIKFSEEDYIINDSLIVGASIPNKGTTQNLESMSVMFLYQVNYKRSGYYLVRFLEVIM